MSSLYSQDNSESSQRSLSLLIFSSGQFITPDNQVTVRVNNPLELYILVGAR